MNTKTWLIIACCLSLLIIGVIVNDTIQRVQASKTMSEEIKRLTFQNGVIYGYRVLQRGDVTTIGELMDTAWQEYQAALAENTQ